MEKKMSKITDREVNTVDTIAEKIANDLQDPIKRNLKTFSIVYDDHPELITSGAVLGVIKLLMMTVSKYTRHFDSDQGMKDFMKLIEYHVNEARMIAELGKISEGGRIPTSDDLNFLAEKYMGLDVTCNIDSIEEIDRILKEAHDICRKDI